MLWNVTLTLLSGLGTTVQIFFLTLLISLPLGLVVAFGSMSKWRPFRFLLKKKRKNKRKNKSETQVFQHVVVHADHIHQGQTAPLPIRVDGVGQRDVPLILLLSPEVHQNLVFNVREQGIPLTGCAYETTLNEGTAPTPQDSIVCIEIPVDPSYQREKSP